MAQKRWKIHKFGGSSLADADCFRRVAAILTDQPEARDVERRIPKAFAARTATPHMRNARILGDPQNAGVHRHR